MWIDIWGDPLNVSWTWPWQKKPGPLPFPLDTYFCNEHHFLIPTNKYNRGEFAFAFERTPFENHRSQKDWKELFRDGRRHPRPCRLASPQDEDLRLQPGHGVRLLQGETKIISCYKVIFIFFAWNKLVLQSWLLGCSPWLTMWTRKSARESFSSDRWESNITTEPIIWEMWSVIFLQTEKIHLPHPAELVMMSHEAGWAKISPLPQNISPVSKYPSPKNWCWVSKNSTSRRLTIPPNSF